MIEDIEAVGLRVLLLCSSFKSLKIRTLGAENSTIGMVQLALLCHGAHLSSLNHMDPGVMQGEFPEHRQE